jgi:hypothetical protein
MAWLAQSLRLTIFPVPGAPLDGLPTFERLTGRTPEQIINKAGRYAEAGPIGAGGLQLVRQPPVRVDLVFAIMTNEDDEMPEMLALGPFEEQLAVFLPLARALLEGAPPIQRLAFGAELTRRTNNRDESYRYINEKVQGGRLNLDGASEFTYQINRPRDSVTIRGMPLNRLAKWSANKFARLLVDSAGRPTLGPETHGNRLSLDINTSGENLGELARASLVPLFDELVALGREVAERGDVP